MDLGYTRQMEAELDRIEDNHTDWVSMLRVFYKDFARSLERAHKTLVHAKAEVVPAAYKCPKCGSRTNYRFGKNGRFLSCSAYPGCDYAAPIDRGGRPLLPEEVDVACPEDNSGMVLRTGRFGPFLASVNYPRCAFVINIDKKGRIKYPAPPALQTELPCPRCGSPLSLRDGRRGPWLGCSAFPKCRGRASWAKVDEATRTALQAQLDEHTLAHPPIEITRRDGRRIEPGTPVSDLVLPGGVATLELYEEPRRRAKSA
jgi:DNA topoisomerase-1